MWRTVDEMTEMLRYADEEGARVQLVTPSAVKAAAQRGTVGARKDDRGRWLIDDESMGALRWKAKRDRLENEARSRAEARHHEENVAIELGLLRDDKQDLTGLCERLRAQLEQEHRHAEALEAKLEQALREAEQAQTALKQERRISEERLNMVKTLTEALSKPFVEQTGTSHREIGGNASKTPSNVLEGHELLEAWQQYVAQQDEKGLKASKAAFAREHGMAASTFKGRLSAAQRQQG